MNNRTQPLTEKEVKTVYENSEEHANKLFNKTREEYKELLDRCSDPEQAKQVIEEAFKIWRRNREDKLQTTLDTRRHEAGIKSKDPYFLVSLKPITPILYDMFLERGIPAKQVDHNDYDTPTIRRLVNDEYGEPYNSWKDKFNKRKDMYYASFPPTIQQKLGVSFSDSEWMLKKGEITQLLRLMQKAATKIGLEDIPNFNGKIKY